MNIDLTGWTHVHTWHESHGDHTQATYQKEPVGPWSRRVECLVVSTYRDGRASGVHTESDHDYLMARDIRANPARYAALAHHTEPCCTAGYDDFRDAVTDDVWRIFGAAGHGEWAFKVEVA